MRKKLFTLLLAVAASIGTMFAEKVQIGDLYYNLDATNQTAEVTSSSDKYSGAIVIPSSVTYNSKTFSVTSIGGGAFSYCRSLTSVTIGNSVTSIGDEAFAYCSGLTSVTIGNSVTSIGESAFDNCTALTSVTIPNSVTSIGGYAFRECTGLTSVTIGNSVDSIGEYAFYDCSSMSSVTIPNSVTSMGRYAFAWCTSLTSVTIPNSVTSIADHAFSSCSGLTSVTIGNSVDSIGSNAFEGCNSLTSITIPNSVTSIGYAAFYSCDCLTSVTIGNSVTSIGGRAFGDCKILTSITIPNSVTDIGEYAFADCRSMNSVTCFATTPPQLDRYVFEEVDKSIPLYAPVGSISAYKSANQWKDFSNILPIGAQPADVTTTTVTPSATTADIAWPQVTGAATYTIEIKKNGELICTLTLNAEGQLISITFAAPSRNNAPQQTQAAGFAFTVTSLDSGTTYSYTMTAKGNNGNVLKTESGTFTTSSSQGIEEVSSDHVQSTKFLRDGQIFILRGEKVYSITGQEVK